MAVSFINKPPVNTPIAALSKAVAAEQAPAAADPPAASALAEAPAGYKWVSNAQGVAVLVPDKGSKPAAKPKTVQAAVQAPAAQVAAPVAQPKPLVTTKAKTEAVAAAEELINLEKALVATNARQMQARYDELKKQLQSIAVESGADPASEFTFTTEVGTVTFSAAKNETVVIDKDGMLELLGAETAAAIAKYNLTDIKKYLSGEQLAMVTETGATGSRTLKAVVPKA